MSVELSYYASRDDPVEWSSMVGREFDDFLSVVVRLIPNYYCVGERNVKS